MNQSLQMFVSGRAIENRTLAQAQQLIPLAQSLGLDVLGLFSLADGQGAPQGSGPQGALTLTELQADPFDLGPSDVIHFLLGLQVGATQKLIDVGPSLDILLSPQPPRQPTTRIEAFLGQVGISNPANATYVVISRNPTIQKAVSSAFGVTL